jgi:hypothetical protein
MHLVWYSHNQNYRPGMPYSKSYRDGVSSHRIARVSTTGTVGNRACFTGEMLRGHGQQTLRAFLPYKILS